MLFENLVNRGVSPVLERVMSFTQARHEVLVDNISNFDTVGYKMKNLPQDEFNRQLNQAIEKRSRRGAGAALDLEATRNIRWDARYRVKASPVEIEENNILFQDENNRSVEKQMSQMASNALLHNMSAELLKQQYGLLSLAIKGKL